MAKPVNVILFVQQNTSLKAKKAQCLRLQLKVNVQHYVSLRLFIKFQQNLAINELKLAFEGPLDKSVDNIVPHD